MKKKKFCYFNRTSRAIFGSFFQAQTFFFQRRSFWSFLYRPQQQHTKHKQQYNGIKDKLETHYLEEKAINKRFPERLAPYISPHSLSPEKASTQLLQRNKIGFSSFLLPWGDQHTSEKEKLAVGMCPWKRRKLLRPNRFRFVDE